MSELGYGTQPRQYAFPVRNRIIAGLAQVTVVVEATLKGGARITAEHAMEYGRTVMAYPGSRRNPASAGTNQLIYDGATVVLDPTDVLVELGFSGAGAAPRPAHAAVGRPGRGAGGLPRRTGDARPAGEPGAAHAVARRRRGACAGARRVDGAVTRPVLAAVTAAGLLPRDLLPRKLGLRFSMNARTASLASVGAQVHHLRRRPRPRPPRRRSP